MAFSFALLNWEIVDARNTSLHQSVLVKLPVLVAIGTEPVTGVVMPLISEADSDALALKSPELFDEAVIQFPVPFAGKKLNDGLSPRQKLGAIPPDAVHCIGERDPFWVPGIPGVLGHSHF